MKIRLATINAPTFRELGEGNEITPSWREIDTSKFDAHAKDVFEQQVGRIIQVHPDDADKLKSFEGLELYEGRLRYPGGKDEDQPPIGERHQLAEGARTATNPEPAPPPRVAVIVATEDPAKATDQAKTRRPATPGAVSPGATPVAATPRGGDAAKAIDETHADPANAANTKKTTR